MLLSRHRDSLTRAFCVYVRLLLEYACGVSLPCHVTDKRKIESCNIVSPRLSGPQNSTIKFILFFPGLGQFGAEVAPPRTQTNSKDCIQIS
jgi:hypothetical protein